jgi:1-deoxy-D-xylulose-5-phosphate reductoisomerase
MISILGSTGSIGTQTIAVARSLGLGIAARAPNQKLTPVEGHIRQVGPTRPVHESGKAAAELRARVADLPVRVASGMEGLVEAAQLSEADTVVAAMSGAIGLRPALAAIEAKKRLAFANKETLVCAGEIVMRAASDCGAEILPVDSEHSAIFQCLAGGGAVKRLIITASGGPFFGKTREELAKVTRADALRHPNWTMGAKITIDSATLMNKGLEFIEAMHLFAMPPEKISVLVHPQSIVHSLVEFADGAVLAQLGAPDMKLPIQLALTWPERKGGIAPRLDLTKTPPLSFYPPDEETFPALALAKKLASHAGTADCAVMNAANEVAVHAFLRDEISFPAIYDITGETVTRLAGRAARTLDDVISADAEARRYAQECISQRR